MQQNPSLPNSRLARQKKFPSFMESTGHLHDHKSQPLDPILSQINPLHTLTYIYICSTLILRFHLSLGIRCDQFLSGFPT